MTKDVRIIYGTDSIVNLKTLFSEIQFYTEQWPDKRGIILVPERLKADVERYYLESSGQGGLMMAEVLSFRRLAARIFSQVGGLAVKQVSKLGKQLLLQMILEQEKIKLKRFKYLSQKPSYVVKLSDIMTEFKRYGITNEDLTAAANGCQTTITMEKFHDFAILQQAFDEQMKKRALADQDLDLDRLIEVLQHQETYPQLQFLRATSIWVYGFAETRDFTAQEYNILQALARVVKQLTISALADYIPLDKTGLLQGSSIFLPGRKTLLHLADFFKYQGEAVWPQRKEAFSLLAQAEENFDQENLSGYKKNIALVSFEEKSKQIFFMAAEIRRLITKQEYDYKDIAIAVGDLNADELMIKNIFGAFSLPYFMDQDKKLLISPVLRYLSSLVQLMIPEKEHFAAWMSLLRSGLSTANSDEIDCFENIVLEFALQKESQLWAVDFPYQKAAAKIASFIEFREKYLRPIMSFIKDFRQMRTVQQKALKLYQWLTEDLKLFQLIEEQANDLLARGEKEIRLLLVQSWNQILKLLEEFITLQDTTRISAKDFSLRLRAGLSELSYGIVPSGLDCVRIASPERLGNFPCKVLFVLGADRENFPKLLSNEGILLNKDRMFLSEHSTKHFPNLKQENHLKNQTIVYKILLLPTDKLYWLTGDGQKNPSLSEIRLRAMQVAKNHELEHTVYGLVDQLDTSSLKKALNIKDQEEASPYTLKLLPADLAYYFSSNSGLSVTQIERFNGCSCQWFLDYFLRLKERVIALPNQLARGSFLHRLLELSMEELKNKLQTGQENALAFSLNEALASVTPDYIQALFQQVANEKAFYAYKVNGNEIRYGRSLWQLACKSLAITLENLKTQNYYPYALEWTFPAPAQAEFKIKSEARELYLKGKIDRIDLLAAGTSEVKGFRIVDYKSGTETFDLDQFFYGQRLQLPIYLAAWQHAHPEMTALEMQYFKFMNQKQSITKQDGEGFYAPERKIAESLINTYQYDADKFNLLKTYALKNLTKSLSLIEKGEIVAAPSYVQAQKNKLEPNTVACGYCKYKTICHYDITYLEQRCNIYPELKPPETQQFEAFDEKNTKLKSKATKEEWQWQQIEVACRDDEGMN